MSKYKDADGEVVNRQWHRRLTGLLAFAVFFSVALVRSYGKLIHSNIWVEDSIYLSQYSGHGWTSIFYSTSNFLHLGTRLLNAIIQSISVRFYPTISVFVSLLMISYICMAIAKLIGGSKGFLFALSMLLVPSDPEVFGLPSYLFWFTGIYLIALSISDFERFTNRQFLIYCTFALLFGLTGPMALVTLPIYLVRLVFARIDGKPLRRTWLLGCLTFVVSAVQTLYYLRSKHQSVGLDIKLGEALLWPLEASGSYFVGIRHPDWNLEVGILLLVIFILSVLALQRSLFSIFIYILLVASALQTALRVDTDIIHPIITAPRYYFVTYVLTGWLITDLIYRIFRHRIAHVSIGLVIVLMCGYNANVAIDRTVVDFHWPSYFASCKSFNVLNSPVQVDGSYQGSWTMELDSELCKEKYLDRFFISKDKERTLAFRYTLLNPITNHVQDHLTVQHDGVCRGSISQQKNFDGVDYFSSELDGYDIFGSFIAPDDRNFHSIDIKVQKGQTLLFRWGTGIGQSIILTDGERVLDFNYHLPPSQEWLTLTFDNADLPDVFTVKISDRSNSWGSWSAVAVRNGC